MRSRRSWWRSTETTSREFFADLDEIERLIAGDDSIRPRFFSAAEAGDPEPDPPLVATPAAD